MGPGVFGRVDFQPQLFQAGLLRRKVGQGNRKGDVIDRRARRVQPGIAGFVAAVKERENLRVPGVALGNAEEGDLRESAASVPGR